MSNSRVFAEMPKPSITDGMRADRDGRIWCSVGWGDSNENGVRCYSPAGELIGKIHIPETVANVCFGGQQRNRLYICGSTSLYAVYTSVQGAMKPYLAALLGTAESRNWCRKIPKKTGAQSFRPEAVALRSQRSASPSGRP